MKTEDKKDIPDILNKMTRPAYKGFPPHVKARLQPRGYMSVPRDPDTILTGWPKC